MIDDVRFRAVTPIAPRTSKKAASLPNGGQGMSEKSGLYVALGGQLIRDIEIHWSNDPYAEALFSDVAHSETSDHTGMYELQLWLGLMSYTKLVLGLILYLSNEVKVSCGGSAWPSHPCRKRPPFSRNYWRGLNWPEALTGNSSNEIKNCQTALSAIQRNGRFHFTYFGKPNVGRGHKITCRL